MNTTKRKIVTNDGDNCTIHVDETCTLPVYDWNDFDTWTNADWKFIFGAMVSTPVTYVMYKETSGGLYYVNYFDDAEIQFNDEFAFTNVAGVNNLINTSCLIHECVNPLHPNHVPLLHSAWHQWVGYEIVQRLQAKASQSVQANELLYMLKLFCKEADIVKYSEKMWFKPTVDWRDMRAENWFFDQIDNMGPQTSMGKIVITSITRIA